MPHLQRHFNRKNRRPRGAIAWSELGDRWREYGDYLYFLNNKEAIWARERLINTPDFWDKLDHRKEWRDLRKQMLPKRFHNYLGLNKPYGPVEPLNPVKPKKPKNPTMPTEPSVWTIKKGTYKGSALYNSAKDTYVLPRHEQEVSVNRLTGKSVEMSRGYAGQKPSWIKNWLYRDTEQRATSMWDTPFFNKISDIMNSRDLYAKDEEHFTKMYNVARKSKRKQSITPHGSYYATAKDVVASEVAAGDVITQNQYVQRFLKGWKENKAEILFDLALTLLPYALTPAAGIAAKIIRGARYARQFQKIHRATSIPDVPKGQRTRRPTRKEMGFWAKDKPPPTRSWNGSTKGKGDFSMKFGRGGNKSATGAKKPAKPVKQPSAKKQQKIQQKKTKKREIMADKRKSAGKRIKDTFYKSGKKGFNKQVKQLRQFMKTAKTSAHFPNEFNKVLQLAAIEDKYLSTPRADIEAQFLRFLFNVPEDFDFNSIKFARVQRYPGAAKDFANYAGNSVLPPDGYKWVGVKFKTKWAKEFVSDFLGPRDQTKRAYLARLYWMDVYKETASALFLAGSDGSVHYYKETDLSKIPKDAGEQRVQYGLHKSFFFDLAFEYKLDEGNPFDPDTDIYYDYEEWRFYTFHRGQHEEELEWRTHYAIPDRPIPDGKVRIYVGDCLIPPSCEVEIKPDDNGCFVQKPNIRDQCKLGYYVEVRESYAELLKIGKDLRKAENFAVGVWCPWHDIPKQEKENMFRLGRCYTKEETKNAQIRTGLYTFETRGEMVNIKKEYCADDKSPFGVKFILGDELSMGAQCLNAFDLWYKFQNIYGDATYKKLWGRDPENLYPAPRKVGKTPVKVGKKGKVVGTFDPTDVTRRRRSVLSDVRGTRARHEDLLRTL